MKRKKTKLISSLALHKPKSVVSYKLSVIQEYEYSIPLPDKQDVP